MKYAIQRLRAASIQQAKAVLAGDTKAQKLWELEMAHWSAKIRVLRGEKVR